jgi:hypothetical protein
MAIDPRKRQKNLERRKAKQKQERRELARRNPQSLSVQLEQAATAPLLHCYVMANLWESGMGQVLVSRQLKNGNVAAAIFLVDAYCLGVKNAMALIASRPKYDLDIYGKLAREYALLPLKPECARKLVEGAVRYALDLGFPPHADCRTAKLIFGEVSPDACTEEYTFGRDGKPFFIAGPHDSESRCEQILRTLRQRCGNEGHDFLIPI